MYKSTCGSVILHGFTLAVLTSTSVLAGDSWFSKVREVSSERGLPSSKSTADAITLKADSTAAVFDIVISLEADPQGDDDASADSGAGDDDQNKYEAIIGEFADAVCQSANTAHTLGVVRIFRNLAQSNSADILWNSTCAANQGPRANPSGFGQAGDRIWMCDNWAGNQLINQPKPAGFTLGHEWGHYTLGLYDEYIGSGTSGANYLPRSTDTPASPSIMNNQWCAADGGCPTGFTSPDLDFLEFSTDQIAPYRTQDSSDTNAQKRVFGQSGWDTLLQDSKDDPKTGIPSRTRYSNLAGVAPPSASDYTVNDNEANCRNNLDIRWMQEDIVVELLLDRSGSMSGTPIANAKGAANILIDQLPEGAAAIGISSFADSPATNFAIADIPDPDTGVKTGAKTAVDGLMANGVTAFFDGLGLSLSNVESFAASSGQDRPQVVFALTDGLDNNSSTTEAAVTAGYQAADVPIITFGYGAFAPSGVLQRLATNTGGRFFSTPTTLAEIQEAFLVANAAVSSAVIVGNSSIALASSSATSSTVTADSTLESLMFSLIYDGAVGDIGLTLLAPDGSDTGVAFTCSSVSPGTASCTGTLDAATIDAFGSGDYELIISNNATSAVDLRSIMTAIPVSGDTYDIAIAVPSGGAIVYPESVVVMATVRRDAAIAGLVVTASVTDPSRATTPLNLADDGVGADAVADDGTYSGVVTYSLDGPYTVTVNANNSAGTGETTVAGELPQHALGSIMADGTPQNPSAASTPVTESFSRSTSTAFTVSGTAADDHDNGPAGGLCTGTVDDNSDTPGRIDFAGDIDCFSVLPTELASELVFRVTQQLNGMNAVLTIYASDGTTEIASFNAANTENAASGIIGSVGPGDLDHAGMIFTVAHADPTAEAGSYSVSAGLPIFSDMMLADTPQQGDAVDIRPQQCPNMLPTRQRGFLLPVAILGTADFDVRDIKRRSIRLAGVRPRGDLNRFRDVATPFVPFVGRVNATDCTRAGTDGFEDLLMRFVNRRIVRALRPVSSGQVVVVPLTGELKDGTPIRGEDVVVIVTQRR